MVFFSEHIGLPKSDSSCGRMTSLPRGCVVGVLVRIFAQFPLAEQPSNGLVQWCITGSLPSVIDFTSAGMQP